MIGKILKKHVTLSMSNGSVLEGFISDVDDFYAELTEMNNQTVLVNLKDISFARLGIADFSRPEVESEPDLPYNQFVDRTPHSEDFTMPAPTPGDESDVYRKPKFVRTTGKNDIE